MDRPIKVTSRNCSASMKASRSAAIGPMPYCGAQVTVAMPALIQREDAIPVAQRGGGVVPVRA